MINLPHVYERCAQDDDRDSAISIGDLVIDFIDTEDWDEGNDFLRDIDPTRIPIDASLAILRATLDVWQLHQRNGCYARIAAYLRKTVPTAAAELLEGLI